MKKTLLIASALIGATVAMVACQKYENTDVKAQKLVLPAQLANYKTEYPAHFLQEITQITTVTDASGNMKIDTVQGNAQNPKITNAGATLGRVLFYDRALSINNSVACASCHLQANAFSDNVAHSKGFAGSITPRNSMAIVNVGINNNLFWDSRAQSVPELVSQPILNHIEMGMENTEDLINKLKKIAYYAPLFEAAFGTGPITSEKIADGMSQFLTSIKSTNSKFDQGVASNFANFSNLELTGKNIFMSDRAQCVQCHAGVNFSAPDNNPMIFNGGSGPIIDPGFPGGGGGYGSPEVRGTANIGLDLIYADQGKANGKFKIPSLRNIALTAPYMHDGRFTTLAQVINHYSQDIKPHTSLDDKFVGKNGLNFTDAEKKALVAFLNTLTDHSMVGDAKFSSPFVVQN